MSPMIILSVFEDIMLSVEKERIVAHERIVKATQRLEETSRPSESYDERQDETFLSDSSKLLF